MELKRQNHEFPPVYDENSEILILGSFPSVKSREMQFFYGHPQNRFWKVMAQVLDEKVPQTIPEKKEMLLRHHIALWDVIASCDIAGSSDSSIRNEARLRRFMQMGQNQNSCMTSIWQKSWGLKQCSCHLPVRRMRLTVWSGCWNIGKI